MPSDNQTNYGVHDDKMKPAVPNEISTPTAALQLHHDRPNPQTHTSTSTVSPIEPEDPKEIILQGFSPRVFVLASPDTQELVRLKGIFGGLTGLLRPFGENIVGNVVTRDSSGTSKTLTNFGVHFVPFPRDADVFGWHAGGSDSVLDASRLRDGESPSATKRGSAASAELFHQAVNEVVRFHLSEHNQSPGEESPPSHYAEKHRSVPSYYRLHLRKLLAGRSLVPHDSFTHPVACLIAISSQSPAPIDTLRDLYNETRHSSSYVPSWLSDEFLRYYILIHDEDHDDITRTTALFDQMKRHFGLHCHLLRIRSVQCDSRAEDTVRLPPSRWLSPSEEAEVVRRRSNYPGVDELQEFLFESDTTVIKSFVREMVTQSIIPFVEGRITTWNDQVASRRRGLSGRFMSFSKRWTAFGSGRASKTAAAGPAGSNYNANLGAYPPDSPEAIMHRLAGCSFMLRDWKLASSTYDLLRVDFSDDKAWAHAASANEMAALAILLNAQSTIRPGTEAVDQMLDSASYSYLSRCSDAIGAVRCLALAVELYRDHGDVGIVQSTTWAHRLLELSIINPLSQCVMTEHLARTFQLRSGAGSELWGSQCRKAALWHFLASNVWLMLEMDSIATERLGDAKSLYAASKNTNETPPFQAMTESWNNLHQRISALSRNNEHSVAEPTTNEVDEEREELDERDLNVEVSRRRSVALRNLPAEPLSLYQKLRDNTTEIDDGFS